MGYSISRDDYIERLERVKALLDGPGLQDYPSLTTFLNTHTTRPSKPYRDYLKELIGHIITAISQNKPTEIISNGDAVSAYALTISRGFLAKLWGCSRDVASYTSLLLACSLCVNRHTSRSKIDSPKLKKGTDKYPHVIYAYWIDAWTPGQLATKERRAEAWIRAGKKRGGITKQEAISIWGQSVADAVSQDGREKDEKRLKAEKFLRRAYEAVISAKEPGAPATRAELEESAKRFVPKRLKDQPSIEQTARERYKHYVDNIRPFEEQWTHKPPQTLQDIRAEVRREREEQYKDRCRTCFNSWWDNGLTQLRADYGLKYRQLTRAEKTYYGIPGRNVWGLVPVLQAQDTNDKLA